MNSHGYMMRQEYMEKLLLQNERSFGMLTKAIIMIIQERVELHSHGT